MNKELISKVISYNYNEFGEEFGDCIVDMKNEIERLNNRLKTSNDTCNYLRNTIDKAIEYIDRRDIEWGSEEHNILLSILKGSESNE